MTLEQQLRQLENQRNAHWRAAGYEFVHWKHDVRRAVSPSRLIRKHLGISLLVAGVLGMLVAPGGGGPRPAPSNHSDPRPSPLAGLWRLAQRVIPQLRNVAGTDSTAPQAPPASSNHHDGASVTDFLRDLVLPLLLRLDWQAITAAWVAGITHRHTATASPVASAMAESSRPTNAPTDSQPAITRPRPPGDDRDKDDDVDTWSG